MELAGRRHVHRLVRQPRDPCAALERGVDSADQTLDVLVAPDRSWQFKDEGDLRTLDPAEAATVRAEGARLAKLAQTATFPFDGTWLDFTPPPEWTPAALPAWWDAAGA